MLPEGAIFFHEIWAATLISLSLALHRREWRLSVAFGIAALAIRELALLYVLVMAACALWQGRRTEAAWWSAGILAFAIGLTLHAAWIVTNWIGPEARQGGSWLALGGWSFVLLATSEWNALIVAAGHWLAAFWLPLALIGAAASNSSLGCRLMLTVAGYTVSFLFIGREDNTYWGIIYTPLVAVSLAFAPHALRSLWLTSRAGSR